MEIKKDKMHIGAQVPVALSRKLDELARITRRSKSDVIRLILEQARVEMLGAVGAVTAQEERR